MAHVYITNKIEMLKTANEHYESSEIYTVVAMKTFFFFSQETIGQRML